MPRINDNWREPDDESRPETCPQCGCDARLTGCRVWSHDLKAGYCATLARRARALQTSLAVQQREEYARGGMHPDTIEVDQ